MTELTKFVADASKLINVIAEDGDPETHEELKNLTDRLGELACESALAIKTVRMEVKQRHKEKLEDLQQHMNLLKAEVAMILRPAIGYDVWINGLYVCPASWDCKKSPVGWCVYNEQVDKPHDNCIFCGQAEDRK